MRSQRCTTRRTVQPGLRAISAAVPRVVSVAFVLATLPHVAAPAEAQTDVESYAEAFVSLTSPRWVGPRTPSPEPEPRPPAAVHARSLEAPVAVHGQPADGRKLDRALAVAVAVRAELEAMGLPPEPPDGRRGGGPETDFYFVPDLDEPYAVAFDERAGARYFDTAVVHVRLARWLDGPRLEACAAEAYLEARLFALDPGESPRARRAAALVWGRARSGDDACHGAPDAADTSPTLGRVETPARLAAFFDFLGARVDPSAFLSDVFTLARQRTWEGDGYRASPNVVEVLAYARRPRGRAFADDLARLGGELATRPVGPPAYRASLSELPIRTAPHDPPLPIGGGAYAELDVRGARPGERLRVFLRGEAGTRWSLHARAFDAADRELSAMTAPTREREPNAYVALELDGAARVRIVVTHVGIELPDPYSAPTLYRTFHLVVDRADEGTPP